MSIGRFERMVGIPEDEYHHLKSLQASDNPLQKKYLSLSSDYRKQGFIHDPQVRVARQGETLSQIINLKDEIRKRLVESTPRPFQTRVQSLFQFISDKINVNNKGEMYDKDGAIIEGSNISDLIQHAIRDRRRNITPSGWSEFLGVLKENNVPRMILNYDTLDEMLVKRSNSSSSSSSALTKEPSKLRKSITSKSPEKGAKSKRIKTEPDYFNPGKKKGKRKSKKYI